MTTVTLFSKLVALFLFMMLPFGGFWLGMKYQNIVMRSSLKGKAVEIKDLAQDSSNVKAYKLIIKSLDKKSFSDNLSKLESLIPDKVFHDLTYLESGQLNNVYILTSSNRDNFTNLSNEDFLVTSVVEVPEIRPYLISNKYCLVDDDCVRIDSFCSIGSYNQYQRWMTTGCSGELGSVEGYTESEIKEAIKNCPVEEGLGYPMAKASFTDAKCTRNICVAQNVKISCGQN